jgi:hypothetical protein
LSRKENDGDANKKKKNEKKDNRYLFVKNDTHQNDPQLRMPWKKSNAYLFVCLFLN